MSIAIVKAFLADFWPKIWLGQKKLAASLDAHFRVFGGRREVIVSWWNFA